jgi:hypothetical protein
MSEKEAEGRRAEAGRSSNAPEPARADSPPEAKFFLAIFASGLQGSRIYRAYPEDGAISFLYAGPWMVFINVEAARDLDRAGWVVQTAATLKTGLVVVGGVVAVAAGVVLRLVSRTADKSLADAADLVALLIVFGAIALVITVLATAAAVRNTTKRAAFLDSLPPEQRGEEVEREKRNFRLTPDTTSEVRMDPSGDGDGRAGQSALLSFRHRPTGKWKLRLPTIRDQRAAARAFRRLLGKDKVEVNIQLKKE